MKWLPIKEYEGLYKVSSTGLVSSIDRVVGYRIKGKTKNLSGFILKQKIDRHGYCNVCICKNGIKKYPRVHVLVATAFHKKRNKNLIVAHIDGNKKNNNYKNLMWATYSENESHKIIHGTLPERDAHGRYKKNKNELK